MTKRLAIQAGEHHPYYAQYIDQVPEGLTLLEALTQGMAYTLDFYSGLNEQQLLLRYKAGKWTPKEALLHLIDTERIFSYRALRFARQDQTSLAGFEQDDFVASSEANTRSIAGLLEEYESVRRASIALYKNLSDAMIATTGQASGSELSARAAGFITAGHERHHIRIIKERYL